MLILSASRWDEENTLQLLVQPVALRLDLGHLLIKIKCQSEQEGVRANRRRTWDRRLDNWCPNSMEHMAQSGIGV